MDNGLDGAPEMVKKKPEEVKVPEAEPVVTEPSAVKETSAEPGINSTAALEVLTNPWLKS